MLILERCRWCGELFIRKSNAEKYCCSECRYQSRLESKRKYINNRNLKKTYNTRTKNLTTLGSWGTDSSYHRKNDFHDEYVSIKKQMRFLKI